MGGLNNKSNFCLILAMAISLLFVFPIPTQALPDFDNGTVYNLSISGINVADLNKLRVEYYEVNGQGKWFISASKVPGEFNAVGHIARFDSDFNLEHGWTSLENDANDNSTFDFQVGFPTDDLIYVRWIDSFGSATRKEAKTYYYLNLSQESQVVNGYDWGDFNTGGYYSFISNSWNFITFQEDPTKLLTLTQQIKDKDNIRWYKNQTITGTGNSLYWQSGIPNPKGLDVVYDAKYNIYIVIYVNGDSINANYYDGTTLAYIDSDSLVSPTYFNFEYPKIMMGGDNIYYISFIITDLIGERFGIAHFPLELIDRDILFLEEIESPTLIDLNLNSTYNASSMATVAYDYGNDLYYLFYVFYTLPTNTSHLYAVQENITCSCSDWVNTSCAGDYRKQIRDCNWNICGEYQYISDPSCEVGAEFGQRFRTITGTAETCVTNWIFPTHDIAECWTSIDIPEDCFNVSVTHTTKIEFENPARCQKSCGFLQSCPAGTVYKEACVPYATCVVANESCYNLTTIDYIAREYSGYNGGDTATGRSWVSATFDCRCKGKYRALGYLSYTCSERCSEKYVCKDSVTRALLTDDCGIINEFICTYGCDGGVCIGMDEATTEEASESLGEKAMSLVDMMYAFAFNEILKMLLWFVIMIIAFGIAVYLGPDKEKMICGMVILLMFMGIGFALQMLPAWLFFIIAVPIVFLVADKFWPRSG